MKREAKKGWYARGWVDKEEWRDVEQGRKIEIREGKKEENGAKYRMGNKCADGIEIQTERLLGLEGGIKI